MANTATFTLTDGTKIEHTLVCETYTGVTKEVQAMGLTTDLDLYRSKNPAQIKSVDIHFEFSGKNAVSRPDLDQNN